MPEQNTEKREKRIKGVGSIIQKMMKPLETDEIFLAKFSKLKMKALINATDTRYAAVINFNEGKIDVEALKNSPEEDISKKKLNWNGKLETDVATLLKIATGEIGVMGLVKRIISRKIKIKGMLKMLSLYNIFQIANTKEKTTKEPSKEKAKKEKMKSSTLFSRRSKFITAGIVGITLPLILTILFMWALGTLTDLWQLANGDLGLFFSIMLFNSLNHVTDMFLLGKGYWYIFIIWAVTGLLIGLLTRDILKSLIIDGIIIFVYMILYTIYVSIYGNLFPDIPKLVDTLISEASYLYPGLIEGPLIFFNLLVQITVESFALPMMILFTLIGGIVNPKPEYYTVFDAKPASKLKRKYKGSVVPSKTIGSIAQKEEKTYLQEHTQVGTN